MTKLWPTVAIPVSLTNPGQFFACCGLFELACRLWRTSEIYAYFEKQRFLLMADDPSCCFSSIVEEFATSKVDQLDPKDNAASALWLSSPFDLRLDWWWKPPRGGIDLTGGGKLKTWAGKQFCPLIFRLMKEAMRESRGLESPLDYRAVVFDTKAGKEKSKTLSPFYFDSRREGTSLDAGFSADELGMSVETFPAVESLALIGLQRFRPVIDNATHPRSFVYRAWAEPLPVTAAPLAVCGIVPVRSCGSFRFTKPSRGGEYMTMFSRARRERSRNA